MYGCVKFYKSSDMENCHSSLIQHSEDEGIHSPYFVSFCCCFCVRYVKKQYFNKNYSVNPNISRTDAARQ